MGRILIIGAGFSGTITATRILQNATHPLDLILVEASSPAQDFGGLAYGKNNIRWEHFLNIQAGRITGFREEPEDFLQWINAEADRSQWPEKWQKHIFCYSGAVPRRMYQQYLESRLQQARDRSLPGVTFSIVRGKVIDVLEDQRQMCAFVTYLEQGNEKIISADQVILATGHLEASLPDFARAVQDHPRFAVSPYAEKGQEIIQHLAPEEAIFIIGTGLSSFDVILSLFEREHPGSIILSSRNGFTHFTYPSQHIHDILQVRRPPFLDEEHLSRQRVVQAVQEEFCVVKQQLQQEKPEINEVILSERIIKAWEPYVVELMRLLPDDEVKDLLTQFKSLIVTKRIGTIPEIGNKVTARMISPDGERPAQIQIVKGIVERIDYDTETSLTVSFREMGRESTASIRVGAVICAVGQETDYAKTRHPLWRKLIDEHGIATPHKKTRRGIEVGPYGELIKANGESSDLIYAVGPMRQGDEVQRHGRLGAFVFSIGTTRNQAFETALQALRKLEEKQGYRQRGMLDLRLAADSKHPAHAIAAEAIRMSATLPGGAPPLEAQLTEAVSAFLDADLLVSMKQKVALEDKEKQDAAREHILTRQTNFAMLLRKLGLEEKVIRAVIGEAFQYIEKVALQQLTDISKLADKDFRR